MRKAELITQLTEKTGVQRVDVLVVLEAFFQEVRETLSTGDEVYIRGFGTFSTKHRAAKVGRHILKNEPIDIPEHYTPCFRPAQQFVDAIKEISIKQINAGSPFRKNNKDTDTDTDE